MAALRISPKVKARAPKDEEVVKVMLRTLWVDVQSQTWGFLVNTLMEDINAGMVGRKRDAVHQEGEKKKK